jgi:hypothetical protein
MILNVLKFVSHNSPGNVVHKKNTKKLKLPGKSQEIMKIQIHLMIQLVFYRTSNSIHQKS